MPTTPPSNDPAMPFAPHNKESSLVDISVKLAVQNLQNVFAANFSDFSNF